MSLDLGEFFKITQNTACHNFDPDLTFVLKFWPNQPPPIEIFEFTNT